MHRPSPTSNFWGTVPLVSLSLRPCHRRRLGGRRTKIVADQNFIMTFLGKTSISTPKISHDLFLVIDRISLFFYFPLYVFPVLYTDNITIRLDYCLSLYSGLPSVLLASLSRVLRSAARLVGQIPKFGYVSGYMLEVLHWLPIRQRIEYRVASLVWRCQLGVAPTYLIDLCRPVSGSGSSGYLRSSERG